MENIFKNLFSQRHNMVQTPIIQQGSISIDVINAIGTCYDLLCDRLESIFAGFIANTVPNKSKSPTN